jgi:PAS domain S-box-containing protein
MNRDNKMQDQRKTKKDLIQELISLRQKVAESGRSKSDKPTPAGQLTLESEAQYRRLFETATIGIFQSSSEGKVISANPVFASMFGYESPEDVIVSVKDVAADMYVDPQRRSEIVRLMIENPNLRSFENIYRRKDGSTFTGNLHIWPVQDADGCLLTIEGFVEDITERKRAEEELRLMNVFLDSIVENIPDMIFLKDAGELRFIRFNRAGEDLLGHSRDDLLGKNDYDFFPKEQADFFTKKDREVLHGRKVVYVTEEPIQTRNKGERILHTKKVPILDARGKPAYLLGISEDITDRKLSEEKLKAAEGIYRNIFMNSQTGLFRTDIETGIMLEANDSMARFAGYKNREELLSSNFNIAERYVDPDARKKMLALIKDHGQCDNYEALFRRNDGSVMWIRLSASTT